MTSPDRAHRDLNWCLHSPPLVTAGGDQTIWPDDAWFRRLEAPRPDLPLPTPKHPHHFRLGQHFEALLNTWLADSAAFQLRAANLQVQDGKRTVGEFDFLVDHDGETEHWEAAVKFYLGTGDTRELANWYGPNTEDRFDIKYNRLISRQLQLASDPHAEALLNVRNIHVHRSRCFMKGRLFYPRAQWMGHAVQPPMVANPTHERGWWLAEGDFLPAFEDTGHRFVYLPKQLWLSPLLADDIAAPLSAWEIQELIESPQAEQAIHVAEVTDAGEISRGFIVKNQWIETVT